MVAFAERLATPGLEVGKLLRQVRADVLVATGNQQEPMFSGSIPPEDLFFHLPSKLTEPTVQVKTARITLMLVSALGGAAIANTAWALVTPAGESVADFVGAFPSVVLAAGEYTAIAKHEGKMYERTFTVEPGLNHDIEVIAKP